MMLDNLQGKKTYTVALGATLTALGAYFSGSMELAEAIQTIVTAILAATLRHGVAVKDQNP